MSTPVNVSVNNKLPAISVVAKGGNVCAVTVAGRLPINVIVSKALPTLGLINQAVFSYTAGEAMGSGKVVYMNNGKVYIFDPSNASLYGRILGITKTAALMDTTVDVFVSGVATVSGWGLTPGANYFAGPAGAPVVSTTGLIAQELIGNAIDANSLIIQKISLLTLN